MAGLRQRKKERTRAALVTTGLRLFLRQGYEETTVAQIAEAADVAPATFFTYFPAKEDLVFADQAERVAAFREAIETREATETVADVLRRGVPLLMAMNVAGSSETSARRGRLVLQTPALRAAALRRMFDAGREWAAALVSAFPGELDTLRANAIMGSVAGAVLGAVTAWFDGENDSPLDEVVARAAEVALDGVSPR